MVKVITVKARCPKCRNGGCVFRAGFYYTIAKPRKRRRFRCKFCCVSFNFRRKVYFGLDLDLKVLREIERLCFVNKGFINKFDNRKSFFYSNREISRLIKTKFKVDVSKSYVWFLANRFKNNK